MVPCRPMIARTPPKAVIPQAPTRRGESRELFGDNKYPGPTITLEQTLRRLCVEFEYLLNGHSAAAHALRLEFICIAFRTSTAGEGRLNTPFRICLYLLFLLLLLFAPLKGNPQASRTSRTSQKVDKPLPTSLPEETNKMSKDRLYHERTTTPLLRTSSKQRSDFQAALWGNRCYGPCPLQTNYHKYE